LAAAIEPVVGSVYFAKEAHDAFAALGHGPTTRQMTAGRDKAHWGDVLMTDYFAYFCGRGSVLGQAPGEVIAAAFGVFNPAAVRAATDGGWPIADAAAMRAARDHGAVAQLKRILGEKPDCLDRAIELLTQAGAKLRVGCCPMYAGVLAQGLPDEPVLRMSRLAERRQEYRGDAFVQAFVHHGFDGCEIQVLTERLAGFPPHSYSATRAGARRSSTRRQPAWPNAGC
jgi:Helix-turn-helix family